PPRLVSEVHIRDHSIRQKQLQLPLELIKRVILILDQVIRDLLSRLGAEASDVIVVVREDLPSLTERAGSESPPTSIRFAVRVRREGISHQASPRSARPRSTRWEERRVG